MKALCRTKVFKKSALLFCVIIVGCLVSMVLSAGVLRVWVGYFALFLIILASFLLFVDLVSKRAPMKYYILYEICGVKNRPIK